MADLAHIQAVILAGGKGTRLRSVLADRPKVLAEVARKPFVCYLLDHIASFGIRRAVLCTGYMGEMVRDTLGAMQAGVSLQYSQETHPLDTAGAVRLALHLIDSDPVLVMNGDSLFRSDLVAFYENHKAKNASASLMLAKVDDVSRYGSVRIDNDGRVICFVEKQRGQGAGLINGGTYLLNKSVITSIPADRPISFERDTFPSLVGRGLHGHVGTGLFLDIGTPESYAAAESFLLEDAGIGP